MAEYPETIEKARSCGAPGEDAARLAGEIAQKLGLAPARVQAAIGLIDEGNTIPFIARYRKEATGSMDDQKDVYKRQRIWSMTGLYSRRLSSVSALVE